jgi:hypothetical protein
MKSDIVREELKIVAYQEKIDQVLRNDDGSLLTKAYIVALRNTIVALRNSIVALRNNIVISENIVAELEFSLIWYEISLAGLTMANVQYTAILLSLFSALYNNLFHFSVY